MADITSLPMSEITGSLVKLENEYSKKSSIFDLVDLEK